VTTTQPSIIVTYETQPVALVNARHVSSYHPQQNSRPATFDSSWS
jgi:hypothetical protein